MGLHSIRLYVEPNPRGVYTIASPDVPGLVTEGQTPDEVQEADLDRWLPVQAVEARNRPTASPSGWTGSRTSARKERL
jgi:hypothetical protein